MRGVGENLLLGRRVDKSDKPDLREKRAFRRAHKSLVEDDLGSERTLDVCLEWLRNCQVADNERLTQGFTHINSVLPSSVHDPSEKQKEASFLFVKHAPKDLNLYEQEHARIVAAHLISGVRSNLEISTAELLHKTNVSLGEKLIGVEASSGSVYRRVQHLVKDGFLHTHCGWASAKKNRFREVSAPSLQQFANPCKKCVKAAGEKGRFYAPRADDIVWYSWERSKAADPYRWSEREVEWVAKQAKETSSWEEIEAQTDVGATIAQAVILRLEQADRPGCEILDKDAFTKAVSEWVEGGMGDASDINAVVKSV